MASLDEPIDVLHVDDDAGFGDLVARFLERADDRLTVQSVDSPEAALPAVEGVDCVVSDYEMPRLDGLELLEAVRTDHDLPFILFTGKGSEEIASEAISRGVTDYLQKETGTDQYDVLANRVTNAVESHRSRAALDAYRRRLELFFDQSPLGVLELDTDLEMVRVNPAARELLGYDEGELVGSDWDRIVPPEERAAVGTILEGLRDHGDGRRFSRNENVTADGERVVCEWYNRIVTDTAGEPVAIFCQFQDVTSRDETRQQLESLVDSLPGIVYRHRDEPGWPLELVRGNCEALLGYTARELAEEVSYAEDIVHPEDRERLREATTAPGESYEHTYRIVTKDDETRWIREYGRLVESIRRGELVYEGMLLDVTELREG